MKKFKLFFENLISAKDFFEEEKCAKKTYFRRTNWFIWRNSTYLKEIINKKLNYENSLEAWTGPSKNMILPC